MKRLLRRMSLPLLILLGLTLIWPQSAEAARWRRQARRAHVHYAAPGVVYGPPVRVAAPGVRVWVGPGVGVYAPGVRVNVPLRYPSYYGGWSSFGW